MRKGGKSKLGKDRVESSAEFYLYIADKKMGKENIFCDCEMKTMVAIPGYGIAL